MSHETGLSRRPHRRRIANSYVEDLRRCEPVLATYAGIAGHDDQLHRLLPGRLSRPAPTWPAPRSPAPGRQNPSTSANRSPRGHARAARARCRDAAPRRTESRSQRRRVPDARPAPGLRPDADGRRRRLAQHRRPARCRSRTRSTATAPRWRPRPRRATWPPAARCVGCARECRAWTAAARASTSSPGWPDAATPPDDIRRRVQEARRGRAATRTRRFGHYLADELAPRGRATRRRARALHARVALLPRRRRSTSRRPTPWGWEELTRIEAEMAGSPPGSSPAAPSTTRSPRSTPIPTRTSHGQGGVPRLDAGAGRRTVADMADTHFDIPEPVRRIECLHRPDQRRRHLLHRAQRGLHPARAGCGGRCRRASTTSPPGAR